MEVGIDKLHRRLAVSRHLATAHNDKRPKPIPSFTANAGVAQIKTGRPFEQIAETPPRSRWTGNFLALERTIVLPYVGAAPDCSQKGQRILLTWLSKGFRPRVASTLVAVYSLCLVVPPAALALGDGTVHCHTQDTHRSSSTHVHVDGTAHNHTSTAAETDLDQPADQQLPTRTCCGLGCVPAVAAGVEVVLEGPVRFTAVSSLIATGIRGQAPERLYRPPISL